MPYRALIYQGDALYPSLLEVNFEDPDKTRISMSCAALNHRDLWILKGMYANLTPGAIMGSDGVGYINDQRVLLYPALNWGSRNDIFSSAFSVLGMPSNGTFADLCYAQPSAYIEAPQHLSDAQAAALPLAFLTAYRALMVQGRLHSAEKVLITGIGGGVAISAMQLALSAGAEVYVTSSDDVKIQKAIDLGATAGFNYTDAQWYKGLTNATNGVDVVIDGAGGADFKRYVQVANHGARIVSYGGTAGAWEGISPQMVFWKQLQIIGTTMGSYDDFIDMLAFVDNHKIVPIIDSEFAFKDYAHAFDRLRSGKQFGKVVLSF